MANFNEAFDYVIDNEKGLNKDPTDRGGLTKYGVSKKFIESLRDEDLLLGIELLGDIMVGDGELISHKLIILRSTTAGSFIKNLTINQAKYIYQKYFWLPIYEKIEDQGIANYIFDMHVNHGAHKAIELLQRALNAVFQTTALKVDGVMGWRTAKKLKLCINEDPHQLKSALIAVRESLFRCIVVHDKTQQNKLEGWLKRCYR